MIGDNGAFFDCAGGRYVTICFFYIYVSSASAISPERPGTGTPYVNNNHVSLRPNLISTLCSLSLSLSRTHRAVSPNTTMDFEDDLRDLRDLQQAPYVIRVRIYVGI